jgi:cytochrome c553
LLKIAISILFIPYILFSSDQIYINGEQLYFGKGCLSCHGTDATGLHNYPSLAKRSKWDLKRRLLKFRSGIESSQQSLIMIPFAKNLTDREIDELSYFLQNIKQNEDQEEYDMEYEPWGDGGS